MLNINSKFVIDRSANHCHLTEEHLELLFGKNRLMQLKPLAIEGEFATDLKVTDEKGNSYTVLQPCREYSQIEVAMSDYYKLFKTYTERVSSGDVANAETLRVRGISTSLVDIPTIVVTPHVHINSELDVMLIPDLKFPFPLSVKINNTTDLMSHIHLDTDQYAALQGY